jgi:hypothetical protein
VAYGPTYAAPSFYCGTLAACQAAREVLEPDKLCCDGSSPPCGYDAGAGVDSGLPANCTHGGNYAPNNDGALCCVTALTLPNGMVECCDSTDVQGGMTVRIF